MMPAFLAPPPPPPPEEEVPELPGDEEEVEPDEEEPEDVVLDDVVPDEEEPEDVVLDEVVPDEVEPEEVRGPQSMQSVPRAQLANSAPGPPSSQSPSEAKLQDWAYAVLQSARVWASAPSGQSRRRKPMRMTACARRVRPNDVPAKIALWENSEFEQKAPASGLSRIDEFKQRRPARLLRVVVAGLIWLAGTVALMIPLSWSLVYVRRRGFRPIDLLSVSATHNALFNVEL